VHHIYFGVLAAGPDFEIVDKGIHPIPSGAEMKIQLSLVDPAMTEDPGFNVKSFFEDSDGVKNA
jgi:hypothetical protein